MNLRKRIYYRKSSSLLGNGQTELLNIKFRQGFYKFIQ